MSVITRRGLAKLFSALFGLRHSWFSTGKQITIRESRDAGSVHSCTVHHSAVDNVMLSSRGVVRVDARVAMMPAFSPLASEPLLDSARRIDVGGGLAAGKQGNCAP
jgi:hypothetical protein